MICFNLLELRQIYETSKKQDLFRKLVENGYSVEELEADGGKNKQEIADQIVANGMKSKEEVEIFIAIDTCFTYFNNSNTKVCFILKNNVQANKLSIGTIEELRDVIEEKTLTDFAVLSNGLRQFQLKRYTGKLETDLFLNFLKKKLKDYGNQLNDVNLLIILQGEQKSVLTEPPVMMIDFEALYNEIKKMNLTFKAQILISYNENNQHIILNQIYPELKSMKKVIGLPSSVWQ